MILQVRRISLIIGTYAFNNKLEFLEEEKALHFIVCTVDIVQRINSLIVIIRRK